MFLPVPESILIVFQPISGVLTCLLIKRVAQNGTKRRKNNQIERKSQEKFPFLSILLKKGMSFRSLVCVVRCTRRVCCFDLIVVRKSHNKQSKRNEKKSSKTKIDRKLPFSFNSSVRKLHLSLYNQVPYRLLLRIFFNR